MARVISLVSYPFLPAKVGGQKGVALFNKYFSRYHELICVTTEKNDPSAAEGYQVMNILSNSPLRYINFFYFFTLRRIIRDKQATHLILEHPYYGWLGILLKWFGGVKLIVHSHNIEGLRRPQALIWQGLEAVQNSNGVPRYGKRGFLSWTKSGKWHFSTGFALRS